ncbi:hypothetical protein [Methylorubrum populi]|uniref:Uncharacterized protein n=1 Tax=Methylorubrum populi TaxID=223967 RepID=A0A921DZN5_9HYPH|nr:hypothetical protein [Methylorubrum populi]
MSEETYRLDDEALDSVAAAGGHWVVNAKGIGMWHYDNSTASNVGGTITQSGDKGTSSVRSEVHGNQKHFFAFDQSKGGEYLKAVRPL